MATIEQVEAARAWNENQGSKVCSFEILEKMGDNAYRLSLLPYIFPTTQEALQLESVCKSYATQKLTFLFSHL